MTLNQEVLELFKLTKIRWKVGREWMGNGHYKYAVMTGEGKPIVVCPTLRVAIHIVKIHNESLNQFKVRPIKRNPKWIPKPRVV